MPGARNESHHVALESWFVACGSDELRRRECSWWGLARCSFSADSCTWSALLFGGDRLAAGIPPGRFATLWSHHGAAWDSWGSERTGRVSFLWQSGQFGCCRRPVSSLSYSCVCKQRTAPGRLRHAEIVLTKQCRISPKG